MLFASNNFSDVEKKHLACFKFGDFFATESITLYQKIDLARANLSEEVLTHQIR